MDIFDAHVSFELSSGFEFVRETADDGSTVCSVSAGKSEDNEGKTVYEFRMQVSAISDGVSCALDSAFQDDDAENRINCLSLNGAVQNKALTYMGEQAVLFFTVRIAKFVLYFSVGGIRYGLFAVRVMRAEGEDAEETLSVFTDRINRVLEALRCDGAKPGFEPVKVSLFTETAEDTEPVASRFPLASPKKEQTPHIAFQNKSKGLSGMFGGLMQINQTGTEYSFMSLEDYAGYDEDSAAAAVMKRAADLKGSFPLSEEAKKMSLLFRVTPEAFNPGEDREQEILNGYLRRAEHFEALRSFIWTVTEYCRQNAAEPAQLTYEDLDDLAAFLKKRKWLNYTENGKRGFCDGADIHNFFVSDTLSAADRQTLKSQTEQESGVLSLDSARAELAYVYPAVSTIYEELTYERYRDQPLVSNTADLLYAWCSAAYAARAPFYTEDGPMNCYYQHPEVEPEWLVESRRYHEEQVKEWKKKYGDMIAKSPRITFSGKLFVFSGLTGRDEWPEILEKLIAKGGESRGAVSGKTDYLVVDPNDLGESKLRAVKEQKAKGHVVTVVSAEDFLKALGFEIKEEKKEEIVRVSREPVKHKPINAKEYEAKMLTYQNGRYVKSERYSAPIPDGFAEAADSGERSFILYSTKDVEKDDYLNAQFTIYDGAFNQVELTKQFATFEEFSAFSDLFCAQIGAQTLKMFDTTAVWSGDRTDMPVNMIVGYGDGTLHVNAFCAMDGGIQAIRFQINGVRERELELYRKVVTAYLDKITPKTPIALCAQPDDEKWNAAPLTEDTLSEWSKCLAEYEKHLQTAFALMHKGLTSEIEKKQQTGFVGPDELKNMVRGNLEKRVGVMEQFLARILTEYEKISKQNAQSPLLPRLRAAVEPYFAKADMSIDVDDESVSVKSAFAGNNRSRLETPELRALKEAEKRREEEEQRKKEAEEKRRAEEARCAAEEKKKHDEAARAAYRDAVAAWHSAVKDVENTRAAALYSLWETRRSELIDEYAGTLAQAEAAADADASAAEEKKSAAEKTLASLGMFKFGEKKEQKAIIAEAAAQIAQAEQQRADAKAAYEASVNAVEREHAAFCAAQTAKVEAQFPMPPEPDKPEVILREEEAARKEKMRLEEEKKRKEKAEKERWERMTPRQREEEMIRQKIFSSLAPGRQYKCSEIQAMVPTLKEETGTQRTARICNDMCSQGLLEKEVFGSIVYFSLAGTRKPAAASLRPASGGGSVTAENENIKTQIVAKMVIGKRYRVSEIQAMVPELAAATGTQRTTRLCIELVDEGLLEKTVEMRVVYFSLA